MAQNSQNRHSIHPWRVWSLPALISARTTVEDTEWNRIRHPEVFQVHKRDRRRKPTQNSLHIRSGKSWAWLLPRHELYSRLSLPFPWWWGSCLRSHAPDNPSLRAEHFVQHRATYAEAELLSTGQTDFHTPTRPSRTLKRRECEQQLFQLVLLHHAFHANDAALALQREYVEATAHLGLLHNRKCSLLYAPKLTFRFICLGRLEDNLQNEHPDHAAVRRVAPRHELWTDAISDAKLAAEVLHLPNGGYYRERNSAGERSVVAWAEQITRQRF